MVVLLWQECDDVKDERRIPCEVYSRIVGYLRPIQNWNRAKRAEFRARKTYVLQSYTTKKPSE